MSKVTEMSVEQVRAELARLQEADAKRKAKQREQGERYRAKVAILLRKAKEAGLTAE
jgi:hypothetical protein